MAPYLVVQIRTARSSRYLAPNGPNCGRGKQAMSTQILRNLQDCAFWQWPQGFRGAIPQGNLPFRGPHLDQIDQSSPRSLPPRRPLLALPIRAEGAVLALRKILPLLVRAADVSVGGDHRPHPMLVQEFLDPLIHSGIPTDVAADEPLQNRLVTIPRDYRDHDLGRSLRIRAIEGHSPRWEHGPGDGFARFRHPKGVGFVRLGGRLTQAAALELLSRSAGARIIASDWLTTSNYGDRWPIVALLNGVFVVVPGGHQMLSAPVPSELLRAHGVLDPCLEFWKRVAHQFAGDQDGISNLKKILVYWSF